MHTQSSWNNSLKLKRKLAYRNYVSYEHIRPDAVKAALKKLQVINRFYWNVQQKSEWEAECRREHQEGWQQLMGAIEGPESSTGLGQNNTCAVEPTFVSEDHVEMDASQENQTADKDDDEEDPVAQL